MISSPGLGDYEMSCSDNSKNEQPFSNLKEKSLPLRAQIHKPNIITDDELDSRLKPLPYEGSKGASFTERYKYINKIYKVSQDYYPKVKTSSKAAERLRQKAIEMELGICKKSGNSSIYKHFLAILIKDIIKNKGYKPSTPTLRTKPLNYLESYNLLLSKVPETKSLKNYGFEIVDKEYFDDVEMKIDVGDLRQISSKKTCERCKEVYNTDEYNKNVSCKFHGLRPFYAKGVLEYPCCGKNGQSEDQEPCETNQFHVFRPTDFMERSIISKYIIESELPEGKKNILAFDCEMGYTSKGYEMIRLTIVDFHSEKTVYDKIIKPIGEIIDLNTKFSGVSEIPSDAPTFEESRNEYLNANLINKNTILIGHGLENDLQVLRITHSKVIDTCYICFTKINKRRPLKKLTFQFLSKIIQVGEHDSAEDAVCALQIIKKEYFDESVRLDWTIL
ncbi:hypothetical protein QEN19_001888 [Hanseniaspora menglaensis]